ncbi:oxidoreductase [Nocardioides guangzhouensis]|uniref:nitric oxide dioxygenase n=1 Tax=Nocardioides guangzhouensis TaxID=2497878 RepID=A0A4Q4Z5M3_9ACTN|nr:globin domain-containing protein [Nocardioides guangzhouensis]RYP82635.1 oxidoreductase [Nocardioides guangzhouensis]
MDTAALKHSWEQVAKSGDEVPLHFYSHLFLSHPELRDMFPVSMAAQRDKLVAALGRVVSSVDQLDQVVGVLQQLGRDHRKFSVVPEHYNAVGASLLATLKHFLGAAWTEELAADWATAYGVIARTMVEAAEESSDTSPAWWDAEVVSVERRTMDVAVVQLRPTEKFDYAPGQSFAMEIPQRPRLWRYFSPANAPREDGTLELHVQVVDGGQLSGTLVRRLGSGDVVKMGAPVGDQLTRTPRDPRDLHLVAGGTGLAPLRSLVEQVDREWREHGSGPRVHLFHGARVPWNLYDRKRLTELARHRDWFAYTEVVSDDSSFHGARGLVGSVAAQHGGWEGWQARVCGGPEMVSHTVAELGAAGVPADDIRYENFHHVGAGDTDDDPSAGDDA